MMFEIIYSQTATISVEYTTDLDPEDYLDFDSREDVETEIYNDLSNDVDYGDCDFGDIENENLEIPEAFWTEWERLKKEHDKE